MSLHIVFVTYEFPPEMPTGGIGSYTHHMAQLLHEEGHHVTVFSATHRHQTVERIVRENCVNYVVPAADPKTFNNAVAIAFGEYYKNNIVDVLESPEVGACAIAIKKQFPQLPLIVRLHTPGVLITKVFESGTPLSQRLRYVVGSLLRGRLDWGYWSKEDKNKEQDEEYQLCKMATVIVSPSVALKNAISRFWNLPSDEILVVPNPFSVTETYLSFPLERHTKTICFVGKLTFLKGMHQLTLAIKKVLTAHKEYRFVLVGRDEPYPPHPSMMQWMKDQLADVSDRVIFKGVLNSEQIGAVYATSDICVVPSLWENYPNVVMEAMLAGCAVAAARRGGIPEIMGEGNGLLFDPTSANDIAQTLLQLIADTTQRIAFAQNGRKRISALAKSNKEAIHHFYKTLPLAAAQTKA